MNLALRDIRFNGGRFVLTAVGIGLLLMVVMGMGGIYRGIEEDAVYLLDCLNADLWIVQRDTRGPFAELSRIPASLEDRLRVVRGVARARRFLSHTIQRQNAGQTLRIVVQGLAWPDDRGQWLPLVAGRSIRSAHFEMVADEQLGLALGQVLHLGKEDYRIVGITRGMVGQSGDAMAFFTLGDAQRIQLDQAASAQRLEREARRGRVSASDRTRVEPALIERSGAESDQLPILSPPSVSAVLVWLKPGVEVEAVSAAIEGWGDVTAYSDGEQRDLLIKGLVDKSRRQIGLFRILLVIISAVVMALILYTLTLDKIHDIAMLKLMGARSTVVVGMIVQQAMILGTLGYGIAYLVGLKVFPQFPRRVVLVDGDLVSLAFIVVGISLLSSLLGVWRALQVSPNEVLA